MMCWLALETSTARGSLALWDAHAQSLIAEETFQADRSHNAALFAPLGRLMEGLPAGTRIEWILAGTGPGSYSGIRVGLAVANALSLALHAPVFGWASIAGLPETEGEFWVTGDARRGSAWMLPLTGARVTGEATLCEGAEVYREALLAARAEGRPVYFPCLSAAEAFPFQVEESAGLIQRVDGPRAGILARRVAGEVGEAERQALAARPLEPMYLREPYFTTPNPRL